MKRIFVFSMLLLCFFWSIPVHAEEDEFDVDAILELEPISSHYVQKVLDRADDGMAYAEGLGASPGYDPLYWLKRVTAASLRLIDMHIRVREEARNLLDTTPCLHIDLLLIESKMEKVREQMDEALENENDKEIAALEVLLRFLSDRYEYVLTGGRDPYFVDRTWHKLYAFDDPDDAGDPLWCCPQGLNGNTCTDVAANEREAQCTNSGGTLYTSAAGCAYDCVAAEDAEDDPPDDESIEVDVPLCPFHTDYLPPTTAGFGCDVEAIGKLVEDEEDEPADPAATCEEIEEDCAEDDAFTHKPTHKEYCTLKKLICIRNAFIKSEEKLPELEKQLNDYLKVPTADLENFGYALTREHREMTGCIWEGREEDIPAEGLLYSIGATAYTIRGSFSLQKNEVTVMSRFFELVRSWGEIRPQADRLKFPNEFPPDEQEEAAENDSELFFVTRVFREFERMFYLIWNRKQAQKEAVPIAKAHDAQLQVHRILYPELRTAGKDISGAANKLDDGIRGFTRDFAVFLRASCVYRPCNKRLEQIIGVVLHDECFPYANGNFEGNDQIAKECKDALEDELDEGGGIEIEDDLD